MRSLNHLQQALAPATGSKGNRQRRSAEKRWTRNWKRSSSIKHFYNDLQKLAYLSGEEKDPTTTLRSFASSECGGGLGRA